MSFLDAYHAMADSTDDKLTIFFFLFFLGNWIRQFMQIVSIGFVCQNVVCGNFSFQHVNENNTVLQVNVISLFHSLSANSADDNLMTVFLLFLENRI